jgi:hypothetical protein
VFSFGLLSIAGVILFVVMYLLGRQWRRLVDYANRTNDPPKERIGVYLPLAAIIGFIAGSLAQSVWNDVAPCQQQGKPLAACFLKI